MIVWDSNRLHSSYMNVNSHIQHLFMYETVNSKQSSLDFLLQGQVDI